MKEIAAEELLQHTEFVRRVALALCADEHGAEDLVQETWITALTRDTPDSSRLRGWLAGVVRNIARQGKRGATRRNAREAAAVNGESQAPTDDVVERMETHRRVVSAVLGLPESARQVIVMHYFDGLPPREIAARLGVPVETVRTRVKRGRARLREKLAEEHGSSRALLGALTGLLRSDPAGASMAASAAAAPPALAKVGVAAAITAAAGIVMWPRFSPEHSSAGSNVIDEVGFEAAHSNGSTATVVSVDAEDGKHPVTLRRALADTSGAPSGTLVVRDVDGQDRTAEDGEFFLRPIDGEQHEARHISFHSGSFSLEGVPEGTIQIERATARADGGDRPVVFENAQFEYTRAEPLVVIGSFLRDSTLRVFDAQSGAELHEVRVLCGRGHTARQHPGPYFPSSFCVKDAPSPVLLPRRRFIQEYWVTAKGHAWRYLKVDHETGGERTVQLELGGRLEVRVAGHDPELAIFLRVYPRGARGVAAACSLDQEGPRGFTFQGFEGLAVGEYDVRAEIGSPDDPPRVLAEARTSVSAGVTTAVFLEPTTDPVPPAVQVRGELVLPAGHEALDASLRIRLVGGPALRKWDTKRIPREDMGSPSSLVRTWCAQKLTPGRYLFVVAPVQYGVLVDVPDIPIDGVRIVVPELHPVVVRAIEADTGEHVDRAMLRWTREMPADAGTDAWVYFGLGPDGESATLLVPTGPFFLAGSGPTHAQRFLDGYAGTGTNELTLELPRRIPIEVVLTDGDAVVPWVYGMTCTIRRVGSEASEPCGTYNDGKLHAYVEGPGQYEIAVGPLEDFRQPDPVLVGIGRSALPPVLVRLERQD